MKQLEYQKVNKEKMKWSDEDVPPEIIKRYSDEIAMNYERASDRAPLEDLNIDEENLIQDIE